jgi:hypothetical protein
MPCGISFSLSGPFPATARDRLKLIPPGSPRLRHDGKSPSERPSARRTEYPNANREWGWQWVFPASSHYLDRRTGIVTTCMNQ